MTDSTTPPEAENKKNSANKPVAKSGKKQMRPADSHPQVSEQSASTVTELQPEQQPQTTPSNAVSVASAPAGKPSATTPASDTLSTSKPLESKPSESKQTEPQQPEPKQTMKAAEQPPEDQADRQTAKQDHPSSRAVRRAEEQNSRKKANLAMPLSIIAIVLAISVGAGLYYNEYKQGDSQRDTILALEDKLNALQQDYARLNEQQNSQAQLQQRFTSELQNTAKTLTSYNEEQLKRFGELQNKVSALSSTDANNWLLSEADFLVKQAVRKLNNDRDVITAAMLLASADANLIELNDPSLTDIRRAITRDIATLNAIQRFDAEGVVIKLEQLSNQLDTLPLQVEEQTSQPLAGKAEDLTLSESVADWKDNLTKSWKSFMADFVTVKKRTATVESGKIELTPNQSGYLRENIRLQLLVAAQAVPRQQQNVYDLALQQALQWIKSYYNPQDPAVQAVIGDLEKLQTLKVKVNVPTELTSQPLLDKAVQVRVRNLLAQNASTNNGQGA